MQRRMRLTGGGSRGDVGTTKGAALVPGRSSFPAARGHGAPGGWGPALAHKQLTAPPRSPNLRGRDWGPLARGLEGQHLPAAVAAAPLPDGGGLCPGTTGAETPAVAAPARQSKAGGAALQGWWGASSHQTLQSRDYPSCKSGVLTPLPPPSQQGPHPTPLR